MAALLALSFLIPMLSCVELGSHNGFLKYRNIQSSYRVKVFHILCWKLKVVAYFFSRTLQISVVFHSLF